MALCKKPKNTQKDILPAINYGWLEYHKILPQCQVISEWFPNFQALLGEVVLILIPVFSLNSIGSWLVHAIHLRRFSSHLSKKFPTPSVYIPNNKKLPKPISPTFNFSVLDVYVVWVQSGKLTWNLKITCLKREIIFQTFIFGFHVTFQGCIFFETNLRFRAFFLGSCKTLRSCKVPTSRFCHMVPGWQSYFCEGPFIFELPQKSWCDLCCHDTLAWCDDKWLIIAISLPSVSILTVTGVGLASPVRTICKIIMFKDMRFQQIHTFGHHITVAPVFHGVKTERSDCYDHVPFPRLSGAELWHCRCCSLDHWIKQKSLDKEP